MSPLFATRIAGRHLAVEAPPTTTRRTLFSSAARRALLQAFGVRAMPFFDLYDLLRGGSLGDPPPAEGYVDAFRASSRMAFRLLTSEATRAKFHDSTTLMRPLLAQLDAGQDAHHTYIRLAGLLGSLIVDVATDRGVYLTTMSAGSVGWVVFRVMSAREQKLEELRRNDPATFETVQKSRSFMRELDRRVEKEILAQGWVPARKEIFGRPVLTGTDPISQDELVFDLDGDLLTIPEYISKRKRDSAARKKLTKVFPDIGELRKFGDDEIATFTVGDVEYLALTDDKVKSSALTRIYPTKKTIDGDVIVVEGRYKGLFFDDLVNRAGRMIEGVAYDVDPKSGVPVSMEATDAAGNLTVRASREPYVTVGSTGQLFLRIPSNRQHTATRNAIAELAKLVPTIQYEEGSRKSAFTFRPEDFAAVREALGGMALSQAAAQLCQKFFAEQAKHELALSEDNLRHFSADKIGGFKPGVKLFHKQKQAMAWLESRKHSGVVALDTGVGKTILAVASMQKMVRDGLLEEGQQFLYVCPAALRGNLPKTIEEVVDNPASLGGRVRVMSYAEFTKAAKSDPTFATRYAAVLFDEAQALKNPSSGAASAAMKLQHPRKILLTASPMEKSPMEVLSLVAVTTGQDLNTTEGRALVRAFRKRFCEEVGGKVIGIKNDPTTARDFRVWVKQNLYFADKRDVEEIALPQLRATTTTVQMDAAIEPMYREASREIATTIKGMVSKYRDRNPAATDPAIESARIKLAKQFRVLFNLINFPEKFVPGARNPKLDEATRIIDERVGAGRRTLLFTDSPELANTTARSLSQRFPVHLHAECASDAIRVWQSGQVVKTYKPEEYRDEDRVWAKGEWKGFVLDRVVTPNASFLTCLLTSTYAVGQNLQAFDTVVHLDRDGWNNETMKQRTARAWRTGQTRSVDEYVLDAVYAEPAGDEDTTLDQIAGYLQGVEADLFDRVILESQSEALGKEWFSMRRLHSSFVELNRRVLELSLSPYATKIGQAGVQGKGG